MTKPVYLVSGRDPVLVAQRARAIVDEAIGDRDRSLALEDHGADSDVTLSAVVDAARTPPFLTDRRVIVVRGIGDRTKDELGPLFDYLADPDPASILVLVHDAGGRLLPTLTKAVAAAGEHVKVADGDGRKADGAIRAAATAAGVVLDDRARKMLADHLGDDLGRVEGIVAAAAAAFGEGARISADDLAAYMGDAGSAKPWDLTDAIDRGRTADALEVLGRLRQAGAMHPMQLMATLTNHYGRAIRLDGTDARNDKDAAAILGMKGSTFPARKALDLSRRLGPDRLRRVAELLADADLDLRGVRHYGEVNDDLGMEILIARLAQTCR